MVGPKGQVEMITTWQEFDDLDPEGLLQEWWVDAATGEVHLVGGDFCEDCGVRLERHIYPGGGVYAAESSYALCQRCFDEREKVSEELRRLWEQSGGREGAPF
jgi:hypothetical protein